MTLLEVNDLKTYFKTQEGTLKAVDGISFDLDKGQAMGLAGESGCGKTTAALSIMKLLPANGYIAGGNINFLNQDMAKITGDKLRRSGGGTYRSYSRAP
jgi:peptide/nickel transport system ATP-binding protein